MKRNDIIDHLVSVLSSIATAEGYNTDPAEVGKHARHWDQVNEFPVIFVWPEAERIQQIQGSPAYLGFLTVTISGLESNPEDTGARLQYLLDDVFAALNAITYDYRDSTKILTVETDAGTARPFGWCQVTIEIMYQDTQ